MGWKNIKYNPGEKSLKAPFAIYLDLECLLKKVQSSQNNPEKSYTEKKARHEPSGWAIFTTGSFDGKENEPDYYRRKDCIEKLCKKLKEQAIKIINCEEEEMILLTKEENNQKNQLAEEFNGKLNCIRDNMEKYITFYVPIKKEVNNNDGKKREKLCTNLNLLIVLDLCRLHYQNLLITCLEFLIV